MAVGNWDRGGRGHVRQKSEMGNMPGFVAGMVTSGVAQALPQLNDEVLC